ncbi:hypothetical protein JTE90_010991 [Oedothorax gibbosus]|uniref:Uncharacterized protein n=1 Tax=Oedothorax gibbosus TaxID=931172 RepID=A0AAV6VCX7_9ARAC|nr:hypothetical protein JTE90_010991 [Oedothorax gibbosus]
MNRPTPDKNPDSHFSENSNRKKNRNTDHIVSNKTLEHPSQSKFLLLLKIKSNTKIGQFMFQNNKIVQRRTKSSENSDRENGGTDRLISASSARHSPLDDRNRKVRNRFPRRRSVLARDRKPRLCPSNGRRSRRNATQKLYGPELLKTPGKKPNFFGALS